MVGLNKLHVTDISAAKHLWHFRVLKYMGIFLSCFICTVWSSILDQSVHWWKPFCFARWNSWASSSLQHLKKIDVQKVFIIYYLWFYIKLMRGALMLEKTPFLGVWFKTDHCDLGTSFGTIFIEKMLDTLYMVCMYVCLTTDNFWKKKGAK